MNKICKTWDELTEFEHQEAIVEARFQPYEPWKKGKGAGHKFWEWELRLIDGKRIPVKNLNEKIDLSDFGGKRVRAQGTVFYGIVIGSPDPHMQSATGYRFDLSQMEVV